MVYDTELEAFKTQIDLRQYAASHGYEWDRRDSWRGSTVMRSGADKIIIKLNSNGHHIYFSVRDDRDNGTIIDFVQHRHKVSIGAVRKELRPWIGKPVSPALPVFPELVKTAKDLLRVETEYRKMAEAVSSPYLESRGIPSALLQSPRFAGLVRLDERSNVVFPHFNLDGLCGYEFKNRDFTGFASGGEKGLWLSHEEPGDARLVVAESAIDALSHAVLFPCPSARYASIGGKLNPKQPALLQAAIARLPANAMTVAAMDADTEGRKLADDLRSAFTAIVETQGRSDLRFVIEEPSTGKDWNDQLQGEIRAGRKFDPSPLSPP